jgi:hypothetical protein
VKWTFSRKRPSDKTRDPVVSEFFSSEAIKDAGEALVREAIQNSLDARRDDAAVVSVRVYVSGTESALEPESASRWFDGAWPHYLATGNGLRPGDVTVSTPCRFLVFEDFGTTGLTGDREQYEERSASENPFFYFFRAEAKTAKHGDARGRWGVGKQVFPRASRAQTFFGYSETDDGGFVMGGCILKHHWVHDACYKPDGFWGERLEIDGDTIVVPVTDEPVLAQFRADFRVRRIPGEKGLSVVVPWLDNDDAQPRTFDRVALVFAILQGYFVPILEGRLEASVEDESGSFHLSRTTYREVLSQLREIAAGKRDQVERLDALLDIAERVVAGDYLGFDLGPGSTVKAGWTDTMLDETAASVMRDALKEGHVIGVRAAVPVRPKVGEAASDGFTCFIAKNDGVSGRACHVREDLIISDVKSPKIPGHAALVRVDHGPLATLLGDSENPAHTEWQPSSRNFKDKYVYGGLAIDFVSGFASELLRRIHASSRQLDRTLLLDLFSDPGPEVSRPDVKPRPKVSKETDPLPDPPPSPPARYRIHQVERGFVVTSSNGSLPAGTELTVRAAYETSKGNPFKAYDVNDFHLTSADLSVEVTGAEIALRERNELRVVATGEDLEIRVTGFDVNRDLQVRVTTQDPIGPPAEDVETASSEGQSDGD